MEPPAYSPPEGSSVPRRSIQDLRAQIIANGSVLRPSRSKDSSEHIEIVVARAPAASAQSASRRNTHWTESQAFALARGLSGAELPAHLKAPPAELMDPASGGQYYGVLIKRNASGISGPRIILKGEARDSVEEALEWVLQLTEKMVHDLVVRQGKPADGVCCVM